MPTDLIHIVGTGGHAKVVVDVLLAAGIARLRFRFSDINLLFDGMVSCGIPVKMPAVRPEMCAGFFHGAVVSHDCCIAACTYVASNATLARHSQHL